MKRNRTLVMLMSFLFLITVSASAESALLTQQQKTIGENASALSSVLPLAVPGPIAGKCVAEGMSALQSAPDEIQTEPESDTQPVIEGITSKQYYNSYGDFLFEENYLYYDNGLPCVKTLLIAERNGIKNHVYLDDVYSVLYLYDSDGVLCDTVIDASYSSYDEATGVVTFQADYDGNIHTFSIAPETESIEQEKYMVDSSRTKEWTGVVPTAPFENTDNWSGFYLEQLFSGQSEGVSKCTLIMLDDDSFPELLMRYEVAQGCTKLYTKNDSTLLTPADMGNWSYIPYSGMALCRDGHSGTYSYTVYKLENDAFAMLSRGIQNAQIEDSQPVYDVDKQKYVCDYTWDGETVDEETFENIVANALGDNAVVAKMMLSYEQCDVLLRHIAGR